MQYSTAALIASSLFAGASAAPSPAYPTYQPKEYYQSYYPNTNGYQNGYQNYYPYLAAKPQFQNAYERQQEYDAAISASENENANSNENLAGAKSENANENANLAKGGEAFGFGALESDNRNLLATENNIEVANANKNELGVEVANFNANENSAQQESAALAEVQDKGMDLFEDFLENGGSNVNDNQNGNCGSVYSSGYRRPIRLSGGGGGRKGGYNH
ncbi:hypothetical protein B9Z19DRAFT_1067952 [Tuber borchii]|uniref:Uncharacterized protein n=1 Tax=Tuber borchii TaxID=42251 RepID=A0A2T6ZH19_TUBBO|nr:hypothetical protein B9Z19DRAFT_1067952 [Tuber borchii]